MKNVEQLVNETMKSLDGVQRAASNPFLYTRIERRLKNGHELSYQRKLMPVLAVALTLFISINVLSYFKVNDETSSANSNTSGIESFANEYNLSEEGL